MLNAFKTKLRAFCYSSSRLGSWSSCGKCCWL